MYSKSKEITVTDTVPKPIQESRSSQRYDTPYKSSNLGNKNYSDPNIKESRMSFRGRDEKHTERQPRNFDRFDGDTARDDTYLHKPRSYQENSGTSEWHINKYDSRYKVPTDAAYHNEPRNYQENYSEASHLYGKKYDTRKDEGGDQYNLGDKPWEKSSDKDKMAKLNDDYFGLDSPPISPETFAQHSFVDSNMYGEDAMELYHDDVLLRARENQQYSPSQSPSSNQEYVFYVEIKSSLLNCPFSNCLLMLYIQMQKSAKKIEVLGNNLI